MLILVLTYTVLAFGGLFALALVILRIGTLMGDCPVSAARARTAALTITTGFVAIGAGGAILIGAGIPFLAAAPLSAVMLALGCATLCLGLGFTHAVATLRAVTQPPAADSAAPLQPVEAPVAPA